MLQCLCHLDLAKCELDPKTCQQELWVGFLQLPSIQLPASVWH